MPTSIYRPRPGRARLPRRLDARGVAPRATPPGAGGTAFSCLGDLLLERWHGPSIGITGTAGKTTTTALVAGILRAAGTDVAVGRGARAGNLWPTAGPARAPRPPLTGARRRHYRPPARADELPPRVHALQPDDSSRDLLLARPHRAARQPRPLPRGQGDDRAPPAPRRYRRRERRRRLRRLRRRDLRRPRWSSRFGRSVDRGAFLDPARGLVLAGCGHDPRNGARDASRSFGPHPGNIVAAAAIAVAAEPGGSTPRRSSAGIRTRPSSPLARTARRHPRRDPRDRRWDGRNPAEGRRHARAIPRPQRRPHRRRPERCRRRAGSRRPGRAPAPPARRRRDRPCRPGRCHLRRRPPRGSPSSSGGATSSPSRWRISTPP